jgi:hypothetical protein
MTKKSKTTRFEVSLADRLKQRNEANNAVRMPRLGFKQYCVYDLESKPETTTATMTVFKNRNSGAGTKVKTFPHTAPITAPAYTYGNYKVRTIRPPTALASASTGMGKSSWVTILHQTLAHTCIIDELKILQSHKIQWLKPKHVTMLKLKGHRVEEL